MLINKNFPAVHPVCINLRTRPAKKKWMKSQAKQQQIPIQFFTAELNDNPKRGCMESHLAVIRAAIRDGHKYLFVMEDDAMFIKPLKKLPAPPKEWAMLYLGGTVKHIFSNTERETLGTDEQKKNIWVRMTCWTTHAYIVNLTNPDLVRDILAAESEPMDMEIDRYYIDRIHQKFKCYMTHPMWCVQKPGHSDIEGKEVEYSFMERSLIGLRKPPHDILPDKSYRLKLPDIPTELLPRVSIITPTRNREWIFSLPRFNFRRFAYPPDKLEWIIVDASDTDDLKNQLGDDPRIKYLHVQKCTIAHMRNLACKIATAPIIVHMDDDDYYPPESLIARVKPLVGFRGVDCVGCSRIGVYNIVEDRSFISSDGHMSLSEASMAYTKQFWVDQSFDPGCERGEYRAFMQNRLSQIMDMPYIFVICAINHGRNFTPRTDWVNTTDPSKESIRHATTNEIMNFPDTWDEEGQMFISSMRKYIMNSRWMAEKHAAESKQINAQ